MYENIGGKIKLMAKTIFVIEAVAALVYGIVMILNACDDGEIWELIIGLLVIIGGPVCAWVSSWVIYGFGELIDRICDIERNTRTDKRKSEAQTKADDERISKVEKLRSEGLISEEEYQQVLSRHSKEV